MDNKKKDLNLIMMYLNGWEEESRIEPGGKVLRAWKGYPFDVINALEKEKMIRQYDKSLIITKEGISRAEGLKHQYLKT
jgi:hypothetical protein